MPRLPSAPATGLKPPEPPWTSLIPMPPAPETPSAPQPDSRDWSESGTAAASRRSRPAPAARRSSQSPFNSMSYTVEWPKATHPDKSCHPRGQPPDPSRCTPAPGSRPEPGATPTPDQSTHASSPRPAPHRSALSAGKSPRLSLASAPKLDQRQEWPRPSTVLRGLRPKSSHPSSSPPTPARLVTHTLAHLSLHPSQVSNIPGQMQSFHPRSLQVFPAKLHLAFSSALWAHYNYGK